MGEARALEEREKFKRMYLFLSNTFFYEIVVFDLQTTSFDGKTVFFRSLAEIRLRTLIKSPQKSKFSTHFVQIPFHLHPARQGAHPALSNSLIGGSCT